MFTRLFLLYHLSHYTVYVTEYANVFLDFKVEFHSLLLDGSDLGDRLVKDTAANLDPNSKYDSRMQFKS